MKTNVTYVDACEFEKIIAESGLARTDQKGFVKVSGASGRNVYVASTKRVGRVDISGFEVDFGVTPHCGPFGSVKQQLDFSKPQAEVLADFAKLLEILKGLPAAEKKKRSMAPRADQPKGWTPQPRKDRLALIQKVAAEKGVEVSKRTIDEATSPQA